jgi:cytochrome c oxidase assembly protein subunit 15
MLPTKAPYPTSRSLGILSKIAVLSTFLMIFAGALITSNKAALSDPTWPQFVGSWYPRLDQMVGGIFYEDSHRIKGMVLGLLIMTLTTLTLLAERRKVVRRLTWLAMALVVGQGILGGLVIHTHRSVYISMLHASMAQAFFITVISLAVLHSRAWSKIQALRPLDHPALIPVANYALLVLAASYGQVVLGAGVRHSETLFLPFVVAHITLGTSVLVMAWILWARIRKDTPDVPLIRVPSHLLVAAVSLQFSLGIPSIFSNRARLEMDAPHIWDVAITSSHVLGAAVILGTLITLHARARALGTVPTWTAATLPAQNPLPITEPLANPQPLPHGQ